MLIVDAQVHIWGANTPERPWPATGIEPHRPTPFSKDDLLREMNVARVQRAVIVPPMWEGDRNDLALEAARLHPDRFAVMGRIDVRAPESRGLMKTWRRQPGMYGLRLVFRRPLFRPILAEGAAGNFRPLRHFIPQQRRKPESPTRLFPFCQRIIYGETSES